MKAYLSIGCFLRFRPPRAPLARNAGQVRSENCTPSIGGWVYELTMDSSFTANQLGGVLHHLALQFCLYFYTSCDSVGMTFLENNVRA
jgi:hypothetical protein